MTVEVECATLAEVEAAVAAGVPRILLDNMGLDELRQAVALAGGRAELEASGGITLDTVRAVAETGVDYICVGALTHSAPALDVSLLLDPTEAAQDRNGSVTSSSREPKRYTAAGRPPPRPGERRSPVGARRPRRSSTRRRLVASTG